MSEQFAWVVFGIGVLSRGLSRGARVFRRYPGSHERWAERVASYRERRVRRIPGTACLAVWDDGASRWAVVECERRRTGTSDRRRTPRHDRRRATDGGTDG